MAALQKTFAVEFILLYVQECPVKTQSSLQSLPPVNAMFVNLWDNNKILLSVY